MATGEPGDGEIQSEGDFLAAIDATIRYFNDGDIVEGTIADVGPDEVLLDIGYKTYGVIRADQLTIWPVRDARDFVAVGDRIEALVLQKEDRDGRLILSKRGAERVRARDRMSSRLRERREEAKDQAKRLAAAEAAATQLEVERNEARDVARRLWAAISPKQRIAFFDSQTTGLPEWVARSE